MVLDEQDESIYPILKKTVIVAAVLGVAILVFLIFFNAESYSALYLVPDSYSNYVTGTTVPFVYGVISTESHPVSYSIRITLADTPVDTRDFTLAAGERWEDGITLSVPEEMAFPAKVAVTLTDDSGKTEDVHFWLKGRAE